MLSKLFTWVFTETDNGTHENYENARVDELRKIIGFEFILLVPYFDFRSVLLTALEYTAPSENIVTF